MKEMNLSASLKRLSSVTVLLCMAVMLSVFSVCGADGAAPRSAESVLQAFGIQGPVTRSTYGHNPNGFMAQANGKKYIVDLKNNRVASIENPATVFDSLNKGSDLFIVQFLIRNDSYDKDHHYGEWRGSHHLIPMYILAERDNNGNMVPETRIFSGEGASPGHYHGDILEPKNTDLATLFLNEIPHFAEKTGALGKANRWPGSYPGTITGNDVNIRTGPGSSYKSLGVFFYGDIVTLLNKITAADGNIWYEVQFNNPRYGWIQGWVNGLYISENQ